MQLIAFPFFERALLYKLTNTLWRKHHFNVEKVQTLFNLYIFYLNPLEAINSIALAEEVRAQIRVNKASNLFDKEIKGQMHAFFTRTSNFLLRLICSYFRFRSYAEIVVMFLQTLAIVMKFYRQKNCAVTLHIAEQQISKCKYLLTI